MEHYQTLGVDRNSTPEDIKRAYRKLANQHHPDKGGDTAMFQKIQTAYETLSDPAKETRIRQPKSIWWYGRCSWRISLYYRQSFWWWI
jgi:hypothetical protein